VRELAAELRYVADGIIANVSEKHPWLNLLCHVYCVSLYSDANVPAWAPQPGIKVGRDLDRC
jgi:hypothetical protein